jgi:hypothetical protein
MRRRTTAPAPHPRPPRPRRPSAATATRRIEPRPPTWRDGWAWASAAAVLAPLARSLGSRLGEPVAEDFDFLYRALFRGMGSLLDGGGSEAFWRPLPHQVYYATLGRLALSHPAILVGIHVLVLALGALLVYRMLRTEWSGPAAALAASFPMLAESTRTLIAWPTQFVDVGLYLFSALALHEAAKRRPATAHLSLLAALLCKELALVTALLLPLVPLPAVRERRRAWALGCATVVALWAVTYLLVRHAAHLELPHGLEHSVGAGAAAFMARTLWAFEGSARALFSLALRPARFEPLVLGTLATLALGVTFLLTTRPHARRALAMRRTWLAWGAGWYLLATLALTTVFPWWQPNRSHIGALGAGVALAALLDALPGPAVALVLVRLALLAWAPGPARSVSSEPVDSGAFMDFARLSRLERFMHDARSALATRPRPARGGTIVIANLPRALYYALGGDRAVQVWYRDSTLHTATWTEFREQPSLSAAGVVQFQPGCQREIVLIDPRAGRLQQDAFVLLTRGDNAGVLEALAQADRLEPDAQAYVFHADQAGLRAFTLFLEGRVGEAVPEAHRSVALDRTNANARRVLAAAALQAGQVDEAEVQVDTLLRFTPGDAAGLRLRQAIAAARAGVPMPRPPTTR